MAGINIPFIGDIARFVGPHRKVQDALEATADELDDLEESGRDAGDGIARGLDDAADALDDVARSAGDAERDAVRSLDRVEDAVDDVGTAARDAGEDVERRLGDGFDGAVTEARSFEDKVRDAYRAVSKHAADAADDVKRESKGSWDRASLDTDEFKDEARSNFSEVASSFSGDMESAVDLVQGTLGGLAGSIPGGVGLALGGLAAAGGAFYAAWNENAEKTEERIQSMYEDMLESGSDFLSRQFVEQRLQAIYGQTEDAVIAWRDLEEIVRFTGMTEEEVAGAFAGNAQLQIELRGRLTDLVNQHREAVENGTIAEGDGAVQAEANLLDMLNALGKQVEATDIATERVKGYRSAVEALPDDMTTNLNVRTEGVWSAESLLNQTGRARNVPMYLSPDWWQAQTAADQTAASIRPPTVRVNMTYTRVAV